MEEATFIAAMGLATIMAGVIVIVAGLFYRAKIREMRHRERLAMIERGLAPSPEFEPLTSVRSGQKQRSLSFGIIVVGLGFSLMFLIGVAGGALDVGIGLGGAIAIIGAAFIVRSMFSPQEAVRSLVPEVGEGRKEP